MHWNIKLKKKKERVSILHCISYLCWILGLIAYLIVTPGNILGFFVLSIFLISRELHRCDGLCCCFIFTDCMNIMDWYATYIYQNWRKLGWFNLCILLMMRLRNSIVGIMCFSDDILDHWNAHLLFTGMISWNPIWFMFWSNTLYFSISLDFINFRHWNIIGKALVLI